MTNTDSRFPTHSAISEMVQSLAKGNMDCPYEHNRESLDSLIADLIQYRDSIPTVEYYIAFKLL